MIFQKSQPAETGHECLSSASTGSKAHVHKIHEKAGSILNTCDLPWPVRGDIKKRLAIKPVWGRTAPVYSVELPGCARVIMAAANCSPASESISHGGLFRCDTLPVFNKKTPTACCPRRHTIKAWST
jgi:hypothetical protein